MSRQFLRFTKETTPGTRKTSPGATDIAYIRIVDDSAFPDRPEPNIYYVKDAAGSNRNVQAGYGNVKCAGRFNTLQYMSQAKILLPWLFNLVTDGGGGYQPPYTMTIDHGMYLEDTGHTLITEGLLGCYAADATLKASNSGDAVKFALSSTFMYLGVDDVETIPFADPAMTSYPTDLPSTFQQTANQYTLGGAVRTSYRSMEVRCAHVLDQIYDESVYPQAIKWCGRACSLKVDARYKSNADRVAFNAVTAQQASIAIFDGTNTALFDFKTNAIFSSVGDQTPLGKAFYQNEEIMALVTAASTDLAVTVTP